MYSRRFRVVLPNYTKYWIILIVGLSLACIIITIGSVAEQKIDDLRPRVRECCLQVTENWCIECTKFADPGDFQYYEEIYKASK